MNTVLDWIRLHQVRFLLLVFLVMAAVLVLKLAARGNPWGLPGANDAVDYENIGFHLAAGRGFRFDWDNPAWRALYEQRNADHRYNFIYRRQGSWPTTFRPPMLPLLIAGNNLLFGRQFATIRIGNALFIAGAACLAAALAMRLIGSLGAVVVPLVAMADLRVLGFTGAILTESLALFAVVLLTWLLARLLDGPSPGRAALAGLAFGFAVLCRSIFTLWYPLIVLLVFLLLRHGARPSKSMRQTLVLTVVFLGAALALPTPWWVRNCIVLDAFMPLGTQGGIALPGAYSEYAWRSGRGDHYRGRHPDLSVPLVRSEAFRAVPDHLLEREQARFGARYALEWIKQNPEKLPVLAWRRLRDHIRPGNVYEGILLALALAGLLLARRHPLAYLLASLVAINALAVMATYAASGRFLIPVRGSLYVLAAVGLAGLGRWLAGKIERRRVRALPTV